MSLVHRLREPAGEAAGTLVLLHGRGADENDLFGLFDVLDPDKRLRGVTVGAPLTNIPPGGRHWYVIPEVGYPDPDTFRASYDALGSLLDDELGLDWSRTVVGGWSQGTVMSYALALGAGRPVPAGLLAQSGFIPTVDGWDADIASRPRLPVFVTHGVRDPIISVEFARIARAKMLAGGIEPEYRELPGEHRLDPRTLPDAARWLRTVLA